METRRARPRYVEFNAALRRALTLPGLDTTKSDRRVKDGVLKLPSQAEHAQPRRITSTSADDWSELIACSLSPTGRLNVFFTP